MRPQIITPHIRLSAVLVFMSCQWCTCLWCSRLEDQHCHSYLTYITSKCYIRRKHLGANYKGFYTELLLNKPLTFYRFIILLSIRWKTVAILRETDIRGEDGICLQSCIQLEKRVIGNDENPIRYPATALMQFKKNKSYLNNDEKSGQQRMLMFWI